jgi:RNA-binding protein YhbY
MINTDSKELQSNKAHGVFSTLAERLAATVVRDEDGQPLVVYRGQHGGHDGLQTRLASLSFGSLEAARGYSESPNLRHDTVVRSQIFAGLLDLRNPFIEADSPFLDLDVVADKLGEQEALRIALKFSTQIEKTNYWTEVAEATGASNVESLARLAPERINELYFDAFHFFDDPEEVAALMRAGYDGATHHGNGATACELEYKVFDPGQVVLFMPCTELPVSPLTRESLLNRLDSSAQPRGGETRSPATANEETPSADTPIRRLRNRP